MKATIASLESTIANLEALLDAQVADEGVDAVVVKVVELEVSPLGGKVLAEGIPTLHSANGPLIGDAFLFDELVEVGHHVFGGLRNLWMPCWT